MTKFVLIGGKSKESNINLIEEEIIKLSKKDNPTILFVLMHQIISKKHAKISKN